MTLARLVYLPRYIACYTLIAVAIPVVAGIFALTAVLGTLALAGDFVRVGKRGAGRGGFSMILCRLGLHRMQWKFGTFNRYYQCRRCGRRDCVVGRGGYQPVDWNWLERGGDARHMRKVAE